MEGWHSDEDLPEVDYTEFSEEEIKEMNRYITNVISNPDSVLHHSNFHGQIVILQSFYLMLNLNLILLFLTSMIKTCHLIKVVLL